MSERQGAQARRPPQQALGELRNGIVGRVVPWMRDALDAALREMDSRGSANPPSQTLVEDRADLSLLLRDVLAYERRWQQQIDALLEGWPQFKAIGGGEFALMGEHDLSVQLVGAPVIDALEHRFQSAVDLLDRRLYTLAAAMGARARPRNPFAPRALAESFLRAFTLLDSSARVHALALRHFSRLASDRLAPVYQWANAFMAEAGYELSTGGEGAFLPGAPSGLADRSSTANARERAASRAPDALRSQLLQLRRDATDGKGTGAREMGQEELLAILALLQADYDPRAAATEQATGSAAALRLALERVGAGIGIGQGSAMRSPWQEASIEAVGRLLDALAESAALSPASERLLLRMAPSLLRFALESPGLFDDEDHPALRVLSRTVWLWDGNPRQGAVEVEQQRIADEAARALSNEQQASEPAMQQVLARMEAEVEPLQRRAEAASTRLWQSMRGRERLEAARAEADRQLARVYALAPLPAALAGFLSERWRQWLAQVWLRDGGDSQRFAEAVALGARMVELDRETDGGALASGLYAIEPLLRECVAISGLQDDTATAELSGVVAEYADPDAATAWRTLEPIAAGPAMDAGAAAIEGIATADRFVRPLTDGAAQALTLAWLSPLSGTALLVDAQGARQCVLDAAGLRAAMEVEGWRHRSGDDPVRSALARIGARVRAAQATPG